MKFSKKLQVWVLAAALAGSAWASPAHALDTGYQDFPNPILDMCIQGIVSHRKQWYIFHQYTANLDVPGYIENGGYNFSKGGKVDVRHFWRWRAGAPEETGRELDFAISAISRGFFCVQLPLGKTGYTKDGRFKLLPGRRLVMVASESPILNESGQPIVLPPGNDIAVSKSGVIFVDNSPVDKFKIAVFESENNMNDCLDSLNGSVFFEVSPAQFQKNPTYAVMQGYIEKANVLKALTGDGLYARYGAEASAKVARMQTKTMTSAIQMANP